MKSTVGTPRSGRVEGGGKSTAGGSGSEGPSTRVDHNKQSGA